MLIRDICFRGRGDLIDKANILFVPVFNADGHERSTPYSRPNQRGPASQGWRNTAQNLNLNRDYMKADSPEMRAMLSLIVKYDPDLYIDLHVTDGMDYQYDITFGFDGWDGRYADSPSIGKWLNDVYRPKADAALKTNGHIPGPLIFARDEVDLSKGIDLGAFSPRFSNSYGDLRRLPTVLVENHSLKPYRQRVLGTYVLLEATLTALASDGKSLKAAIASDRALRPAVIDANWKARAEPIGTIDFLSVEGRQETSPASGGSTMRWTGRPGPTVKVPVYGSEPSLKLPVAKAYWVPATKPEVIARLQGAWRRDGDDPQGASGRGRHDPFHRVQRIGPQRRPRTGDRHRSQARTPNRNVSAGIGARFDRPAARRACRLPAGAGERGLLLRLGLLHGNPPARRIHGTLRHRPHGRADAGERSAAQGRIREASEG